jgi:hypothetical protein
MSNSPSIALNKILGAQVLGVDPYQSIGRLMEHTKCNSFGKFLALVFEYGFFKACHHIYYEERIFKDVEKFKTTLIKSSICSRGEAFTSVEFEFDGESYKLDQVENDANGKPKMDLFYKDQYNQWVKFEGGSYFGTLSDLAKLAKKESPAFSDDDPSVITLNIRTNDGASVDNRKTSPTIVSQKFSTVTVNDVIYRDSLLGIQIGDYDLAKLPCGGVGVYLRGQPELIGTLIDSQNENLSLQEIKSLIEKVPLSALDKKIEAESVILFDNQENLGNLYCIYTLFQELSGNTQEFSTDIANGKEYLIKYEVPLFYKFFESVSGSGSAQELSLHVAKCKEYLVKNEDQMNKLKNCFPGIYKFFLNNNPTKATQKSQEQRDRYLEQCRKFLNENSVEESKARIYKDTFFGIHILFEVLVEIVKEEIAPQVAEAKKIQQATRAKMSPSLTKSA